MGLFSSKKKNCRLYHIEIDDEGIDKEICDFIVKIEQKISEFKDFLKNPSFSLSEEEITNLKKIMIEVKDKIIHLQNDIIAITELKLKNQQFFIIKDDNYFNDKKKQLEKLTPLVQKFIEIVEQHPSTSELKNELINNLFVDIMNMEKTIQQILADDHQLREIYKRIEEL